MSDAWLLGVKQLLPAAIVDAYRLGVQAKIVKSIAAEEEWLRLLVHELAPVIEHLHADELPLSKPSVIGSSAQGALLQSRRLRKCSSPDQLSPIQALPT